MTTPWTAPAVERSEPTGLLGDRESLDGWLEYHRATLLHKCAGLDGDQLKEAAVPPSAISLLGLVRHMTEVERWWFRLHAAGEQLEAIYCTDELPDGDFDAVKDADPAADYAAYLAELDAARAAAATVTLDDIVPSRGHRRDVTMNIRWIYTHMIEEYARHNGHADLIRERIDGATGE
jgi:hypothetical protein